MKTKGKTKKHIIIYEVRTKFLRINNVSCETPHFMKSIVMILVSYSYNKFNVIVSLKSRRFAI